MTNHYFLAIDVGTGSVRAALVDRSGAILKLVGQEHQQIVPHYGWAEQRPEDWWNGAIAVDPSSSGRRS
jgi:xylulokinase